MTHLINFFDKGESNVEDSTKIHWLRLYYNTVLRIIISNTTAVLYLNEADYLILAILSETTDTTQIGFMDDMYLNCMGLI